MSGRMGHEDLRSLVFGLPRGMRWRRGGRPNETRSDRSRRPPTLVPVLAWPGVTQTIGADIPRHRGLAALRRGGAVSDLLFLYVCTTREVAQLREVSGALGLTVQAASHTFRGLARRGLAQASKGRYRPTVAGVDFLHTTLRDLDADLAERRERLHIVRTTRALAGAPLERGTPVVLRLEGGLLTARPGRDGPSRGFARASARKGQLVEVERLEGIVPLRPAPVQVLAIPEAEAEDPATLRSLSRLLGRRRDALLAARGLEAFHLTTRSQPGRAVGRFGVAAAVREAAQLGVPSTVVLLDRDAPEFLTELDRSGSLRVDLVPLPHRGSRRPRSRRTLPEPAKRPLDTVDLDRPAC